jgi:nucleotide-binding universal stress UspA family protein
MVIRRILHATDFSPASRPALRMAQEMARAFKAKLVLFHSAEIVVPTALGEGYVSPAVLEQIWTAAREGADRSMSRLAKTVRGRGLRVVPLISEGPPAPAIVQVAVRQKVDLIVIGTHGRTGVKRFLLGSVAERVVRTSRKPVLTVAGG